MLEKKPSAFSSQKNIVHPLGKEDDSWKKALFVSLTLVVVISLGVFTGYLLRHRQSSPALIGGGPQGSLLAGGGGKKAAGIDDDEAFPDSTQGRLEINDFSLSQEGTHLLLRPGGADQTAYLTSSAVNLDDFVGQCVEIKGKTFAGQKAGWLLDVGLVKPLSQCPENL